MEVTTARFPSEFRKDIDRAASILRKLGARDIFIFGSLVEPTGDSAPADIDLAVSGLPKDCFFHAYGQLMAQLDHPFDLVDLETDSAFVRTLRKSGRLEHVA